MIRSLAALALLAVLAPAPARADDENFGGAYVVFARDGALYRTDPKGKTERKLVDLPAKTAVRALRTDRTGSVLLADLGGKWSWMRLDGKSPTALTELPCGEGPAQLATAGDAVICRSTTSATGSVVVTLATGKVDAVAVPPAGATLVGVGSDRRVVWVDAHGAWSAPARDTGKRVRLAPEPPLRNFLPSPDGARAVGVYVGTTYTGRAQGKPDEILMDFALDGTAARRKAIRSGVPVEWSHDGKWVLVQDRASSCIMNATGGEYKCWKGYTSASIASNGKWSLVLGNRSAEAKKSKAKSSKKSKAKAKPAEPLDEDEDTGEDAVTDDVQVAPPSGPMSLYRTTLNGPYSLSPALIVRVVDGAAVWIPGPPALPL